MERSAAKSFMDLVVWQKAHALTLAVYRATKHFPKEDMLLLEEVSKLLESYINSIRKSIP